jgi:hypothetical protein
MATSASPAGIAGDGILDRLRMAIGQALDLAGQIERGRAVMPLRDHFAALAESIDTAPFTLTLLGLDAASRAAALGWLCGEDYHVLSVEAPGAVGLVEVQMAERGYVLAKSGRRQEFDRLEPFLEAVRAADLVRQGDADAWLEPMHLELAAPPGMQGLKLLMPESVAAVAESHVLLARLQSESNVLAVAGPADRELDEPAAGAIRALAADALATWAITCGPSLPDPRRWGWAEALDGIRLPSVHLEPGGPAPPLPDFLLDRRSTARGGSSPPSGRGGSSRPSTCSRNGSSRTSASTTPAARRCCGGPRRRTTPAGTGRSRRHPRRSAERSTNGGRRPSPSSPNAIACGSSPPPSRTTRSITCSKT